MHLLQRYALACGVKIGKPFIYEKYFPNIYDKYIIFHPISKPSKTYDYWQEVIDIIFPILEENGIKIIQIGDKDDKIYNNTAYIAGMTSINQVAYLLKDCLLHFGADSFPAHISSGYDKKSVTLFSNNYINCVKPFFGDPNKKVLLEPDRSHSLPSFVLDERPKTINKIKPEDVANSILSLLDLSYRSPIKTVYFGEFYANRPSFELIPFSILDTNALRLQNVIVRMDYHYNLDVLAQQLQICPCLIYSDKPIDPNFILANKQRIPLFFYEIKEDSDVKFAEFLQKNDIQHELITSLSDEQFNKIKIKYFDCKMIVKIPEKKKADFKFENENSLFYRSSRRIYAKNKTYSCKALYEMDIPMEEGHNKVIDVDGFWKEAEHFYIFEK